MIGLYVLLLLMIAAAIAAVEMKDLLSSVVTVAAAGLGLSVTFLLLKAPDLAIAQLVVEILCLVILIRATIDRDVYDRPVPGERARSLIVAVCIGAFLVAAFSALGDLAAFGQPLLRVSGRYLAEGLVKTGAANLVASVVLDYRAYDTLGEATVLFAAVVGALAVLRRRGREKKGGDRGR